METTQPCWDCCRWRRDRPTEALGTHPAPLLTLCHPPPCSTNSGLQLQLASLLLALQPGHDISALCAPEKLTLVGVTRLFGGMELNFSRHCQPPGGSIPSPLNLWASLPAPCPPTPAPNPVCFPQRARQDPRRPKDGRPPWPGFLFVMAAVQHTFRAINNMYFDLAVHSS